MNLKDEKKVTAAQEEEVEPQKKTFQQLLEDIDIDELNKYRDTLSEIDMKTKGIG